MTSAKSIALPAPPTVFVRYNRVSKAGHQGLGEIIEAKDEVAAAKNAPAVKSLESTWKTVNTAADTALKAEKVAQLGQRAWELISGFF